VSLRCSCGATQLRWVDRDEAERELEENAAQEER
jgi:hypothetical protein